jgi:hypothetical protein
MRNQEVFWFFFQKRTAGLSLAHFEAGDLARRVPDEEPAASL